MNLKGNLTSKGLQGSIGKSRMQGILGTNPAAIPITVDNALSLSSTNPVQNRVITAAITNRLWSDEVKDALLQIVEKVAFIDEHGQDYYDALYDALYPPTNLDSIGAVFDSSATIYNTDTLDDLKQYLTVTAYYTDATSETVTTYTLSGSMDAGTQTITVSYGGKTTTFTITVVEWVTSISAVFTQGQNVICDSDPLSTLRQYLVVTATYADSSTAIVDDYALSGTLAVGTSTITATYSNKTASFSVTVSEGIVTDGLVAYWDGVNNTENGHDSTAVTWEDLSGNYDLSKVGSSALWSSNSLQLPGTAGNGYSIANRWDYSADATIEIVLKPTATSTQAVARFDVDPNYVTVGSRHAHNCRIFALYSDNTIGFIGKSGNTYSNSVSALTSIRKLVAVYSGFEVSKALANNTALSLSSKTHSLREDSYLTDVQIGTNLAADVSNQYPFAGDIYAVRVYNRALSDAEITKNFNSDNAKYALGL